MKFLYRHIFLLLPVLSVVAVYFVYQFIQENKRTIPKYEPKYTEDTWSAEEYMRHLNLRPFNNDEVHRLLLKRTRQKQGVYLESMPAVMDTIGLEIVHAFHLVAGDDYTPVITSGNDFPGHLRTSKHYMNAAFDFRIVDLPLNNRKRLTEMVADKIGNRCKVIWEKGEAEHLHVELLDQFIPKD